MRRSLALLIAMTLGAALVAAPQTKSSPAKKSPAKKSASKSKKRSKRAPAQTQPDAARTRQIQQALERAGYYTVPPTGKWDEATRQAMSRYQQDNGFTVTGKPDALSLKKLGLGAKYPP